MLNVSHFLNLYPFEFSHALTCIPLVSFRFSTQHIGFPFGFHLDKLSFHAFFHSVSFHYSSLVGLGNLLLGACEKAIKYPFVVSAGGLNT